MCFRYKTIALYLYMKKKNTIKTTTSYYEMRRESRRKAMEHIVSSVYSATKFLKSIGVLNQSGNLSNNYKHKKV